MAMQSQRTRLGHGRRQPSTEPGSNRVAAGSSPEGPAWIEPSGAAGSGRQARRAKSAVLRFTKRPWPFGPTHSRSRTTTVPRERTVWAMP